jgi:hypothetical protein
MRPSGASQGIEDVPDASKKRKLNTMGRPIGAANRGKDARQKHERKQHSQLHHHYQPDASPRQAHKTQAKRLLSASQWMA